MTRITIDAGDRVQHRLGRRYSEDARDQRFLARTVLNLTGPPSRTYRYWYNRFNFDQTGPTCVANSAVHQLGNSPKPWPYGMPGAGGTNRSQSITYKVATKVGMTYDAMLAYTSPQSGQRGVRGYLYDRAQAIDEWADTPPEGGTSYRAMAKVLQGLALIGEYRWLVTFDEVIKAVIDFAPVTIGLDWRSEMFGSADGAVIHWSGVSVGGHQIVIDGANTTEKKARVQTWGVHYWLPFADLRAIMADDWTDACLPMEPT